MSRFSFLITLLFVTSFLNHSQAQWACEYTASKMESQKAILTCGVGESEKLSRAKEKARKNAMEEFQFLCSFLTKCQDYDFSVEPLRIDCKKLENNNYRCHRSLRIRISDKKKSDTSTDYKQNKTKLKKNQKEIESLEEQIKILKNLYYPEKEKKIKQEMLKKIEKRLLNAKAKKIELQEKINRKKKKSKKGLYTYDVNYVHPKNSINVTSGVKMIKVIKEPSSLSNTSKKMNNLLFIPLEVNYERSLWKYVSIEFSGFFAIGGGTNGHSSYNDEYGPFYKPHPPYKIPPSRHDPPLPPPPHSYNTHPNSYEIPHRYEMPRHSHNTPPSSYKRPPTLNKEETSNNSKLLIPNIKGLGFATRSRFYLPTYSNLYSSLSYEFLQATIELEEVKEPDERFKFSRTIKKEKIQVESSSLGIGLGWTSSLIPDDQIIFFRLELGYSWPISTNIDLKNLKEPSSYSIYGGPYFLFSMGVPFSFP